MDLDSAQAPKGPPDFGRSRFHFLSVNGCQSKLLSTSIYSEATSPEKTLDWNWFPPAKGLNISVGYPLSLLETLRYFSHEQRMHEIVDIRWPLPTNMLLAFSIPRGTMQCNRLIYPTGKNNHVEKCEGAWTQMENAYLGENLLTYHFQHLDSKYKTGWCWCCSEKLHHAKGGRS